MSNGEVSRQAEICRLTIRFPQVDPAGIVFYPRYFEMLFGLFPALPFASPPFAIKTQFLKPNRLGDQIEIEYDHGEDVADWSITGRMFDEDHFSMRTLETDGALPPDAHSPDLPAFKTAEKKVGAWSVDTTGCMQLSRYFESLNVAIEEWFEDSLGMPFHELHVARKIGIPTVQFNTHVNELPEVGVQGSIWLRPVKIGGRAMTFRSWFVSDNRCLVENEQVVVFVRMLDGGYESIPIPDTIREQFEAQLVAGAK